MSKPDHVLRLKVSLREIKPPIWRRIEILSNVTFWDLHVAIQDAMGWMDCHLHAFEETGQRPPETVRIGIPIDDFDDFGGPPTIPGWRLEAAELLTLTARKFRYEYDFGDGWVHDILLEQVRPLARDETPGMFPRCIAGRRRCPPEDIGGPWRYQGILDQIAAGVSEPVDDEDSIARVLGEDVEAFDPAAVVFDDPNERLDRLMDPF